MAQTDTDTQEPAMLTEIALVSPDDLLPYAQNPKEHPDEQIAKLASAIKKYGWDQPIVVDENNEIIKGHGRLQAAKKLGLDEVPVIHREDLTDAEKNGSRLADNRIAESDWDDELLAQELLELDQRDFDIRETGFDEDEVDDILGMVEPPEFDLDNDAEENVESVLQVVVNVSTEDAAEQVGEFAETNGHEWHVVEQ